jgi:rhamnulokinase
MGAEVTDPVINAKTLQYNFTNEGGVNGTWRLSRNIMGLWLVQESRRTWAHAGEDLDYTAITQMAADAAPFRAVIDPDANDFLAPGDMPARIRAYCKQTGQPVPETKGEVVRVALESVALKYRWVLERLEEVLGYRLDPIHIIGGGTRNTLLNQLAADATGRRIVAGPVEATAAGNILMQAVATGKIGSLQEGRETVQRSMQTEVYEPCPTSGWDEAYGRLLEIMAST